MVFRKSRFKASLSSVGRNRVRQDTHPVLRVALALDCGTVTCKRPKAALTVGAVPSTLLAFGELCRGRDGPSGRGSPGSCLTLLRILKEVVNE